MTSLLTISLISATLLSLADSKIQSLIAIGEYEKAYDRLVSRSDSTEIDEQALYYLCLTAPSGKIQSQYLKEYVQQYPDGDYINSIRNLLRDYYAAQGLSITASRMYPDVPKLSASNQKDLLKIAQCKQKFGDYDRAIPIYRTLFERGGSDVADWARLALADCSVLSGDYESAATEYTRFIDDNPESPAVAFALLGAIDAYKRIGRADKADEYLRQYKSQFPAAPIQTGAEDVPVEEEQVTPTELPRSINAAYYIQVGVFAKKDNARTCLRKFRNLGHQTRMSEFDEDGQTFYRVLIGPYRDELSARKVKGKLEDSEGEKFLILLE